MGLFDKFKKTADDAKEAVVKALAAPDVFVVWLRASPDVLGERFVSGDDHRPAYGDHPARFLSEQLEARAAALGAALLGGCAGLSDSIAAPRLTPISNPATIAAMIQISLLRTPSP